MATSVAAMLFLLATLSAAVAQVTVSVTFDKTEIYAGEWVTQTVLFTNNSGATITNFTMKTVSLGVFTNRTTTGNAEGCGAPALDIYDTYVATTMHAGQYCRITFQARTTTPGPRVVTLSLNSSSHPVQYTPASIRVVLPTPTISSITPPTMPPEGDDPITISGAHFMEGNTLSVTFGGIPATFAAATNNVSLIARPPAGAVGRAPVVVTVDGRSSAPFDFEYKLAEPSLTLTTNGTSTYGGNVTMQVAVAGGWKLWFQNVEFFDGSRSLGTSAISENLATLTTSSLKAGIRSLTARYAGNSNNASAVSAPALHTVQRTSPTISLTSDRNPSTFRQTVGLTATLSGAVAPTGTIDFYDRGVFLLSAPTDDDGVRVTIDTLSVGDHAIEARYAGDENNGPANSSPIAQKVNRAASGLTLTTSPRPSRYNQLVTITATLSGTSAPSGLVEFFDGGVRIGSGEVSGGLATFSTKGLSVGQHSLTANYAGDTNNAPATSSPVDHHVDQSETSIELYALPSPSTYGDRITLTAAVRGAAPGGVVEFFDGSLRLGSSEVSDGLARFSINGLAVGHHALTAVYVGDGNNAPATSSPVDHQVDQAETSTELKVAPSPSLYGQDIILTATVKGVAPTGLVRFLHDGASIGEAALHPDGTAILSLAASMLSTGTTTFQAMFLGDTSNKSTLSLLVSHDVLARATSLTLSSSANPSTYGDRISFTARLSGAVDPAGRVEFSVDGRILRVVPLSGSTAIFETSELVVGEHAMVARYVGDPNNQEAISAPYVQVVESIASRLALTTSTNPALTGERVDLIASVSPANASGQVVFSIDGIDSPAVTILGGKAILSKTFDTEAVFVVAARYLGDNGHTPAASSALPLVVQSADTTLQTISDFQAERAELILSHLPDASRRIARLEGGMQTNIGPGVMSYLPQAMESGSLPILASLSSFDAISGNAKQREFDIWLEASLALVGPSDDDALFSMATIGADYLLSPDVLVGAYLQSDLFEQKKDVGGWAAGTGWVAGPYLTAKVAEDIYLDVLAGAGRSYNSVSPYGTYIDGFDATRWLISGSLEGSWDYGPWTLSPRTSLSYWSETSDPYTDTRGVEIPSVSVGLGQLTVGPGASFRHQTGDGLSVTTGVRLDGVMALGSSEKHDLSGRLQMSVDFVLPGGAGAGLTVTQSGIGGGLSSSGASIRIGGQF